MLFKKSLVKRIARSWLTLLKVGSFLSALWFGYWSIYWEAIYWKKPLDQAFLASSLNWILLVAFLFLFFEITFFERTMRKRPFGSKGSWLFPLAKDKNDAAQHHIVQAAQVTQSADEPIVLVDGPLCFQATIPSPSKEALFTKRPSQPARRKLRIPFLRQTKRVISGGLLILYILLSIVAFPSLLFILFLGTAYLLLDYLRKTRRTSWEKPNK